MVQTPIPGHEGPEPDWNASGDSAPRQPPAVPYQYRRETVAPAGKAIEYHDGVQLVAGPWYKNVRLLGFGGLTLVVLAAVLFAASQARRAGDQGEYQIQETPADYARVLEAAQGGLTSTHQDSLRVLEEFESSVLSQEAHRYRSEAEKAIQKASDPCFGQTLDCAYGRYQSDAAAAVEHAYQRRDWQAMQAAIFRFNAVEAARESNTLPAEPSANLGRLSMLNTVDYHRRMNLLNAEVQANELLKQQQP